MAHGDAIYHRKDGLWEARYVKEIDSFGRKKYGSVYAHSYREAREKRQDALDRILLNQTNTPLRKLTVEQLTKEWLHLNKNRLKLSSYQRYQGFFKNHISKQIGNVGVVYLNTLNIHEFAAERLSSGLSPRSVNAVLVFLHSILKYGHQQYKLPLPDIMYLSYSKKEMRVFSIEEQKKLVQFLLEDMDIYKLGVLVSLYTGMRLGELCALKWENVSSDAIKVNSTMQRLQKEDGSGTELHIGPPKTDTSSRTIPVPSFLQPYIEAFREKRKDQEFFLGFDEKGIIEPRTMQYKFKVFLSKAGIENANYHALRHTFATRCVECEFELKSLSEILGHANVSFTLGKYVHSSFELKKQNMERLSLEL